MLIKNLERLIGQEFGQLTVTSFNGYKETGSQGKTRNRAIYSCTCSCGEVKVFDRDHLVSKNPPKSCGCILKLAYEEKGRTNLYPRYWDKVVKTDGCWGWLGSKVKGYGSLRVGRKMEGAHRISYELHKGLIPEGMVVRHTCDNPECSNPVHLILGTHEDNMEDMKVRGRAVSPQAFKTHCPQGHEYTPENTWISKTNHRLCKMCGRLNKRKYRAAEGK